MRDQGARRVAFYGAGDVMEVAYPIALATGLDVVAIVDDAPAKHGHRRWGLEVGPPAAALDASPDALVITTFVHADEILDRMGGELKDSVRVAAL